MHHTASADLGVPGVRPEPFALLSERLLRPAVTALAVVIAAAVLVSACGGQRTGAVIGAEVVSVEPIDGGEPSCWMPICDAACFYCGEECVSDEDCRAGWRCTSHPFDHVGLCVRSVDGG